MKALMSTTRKGTPAPSDQISHEGATKRAARGQAYASVKTIGGVTCKDGTVLTATDVQNVIFDHGHGNFFPTHVMEAVNDQICEVTNAVCYQCGSRTATSWMEAMMLVALCH
jgi:hypothetical protein